MSKYPAGNFTIVNNDTGRCLRVRLGRTKDVSDWKEGTKYLLSVTDKPSLELGPPDGSPSTAWWFSTIDDGGQPFNQIVSYAVGEYQNIGNHCVWLYTNVLEEVGRERRTRELFANRLANLPAELDKKLSELIPEDWTALQNEHRADSRVNWTYAYRRKVGPQAWMEAVLHAWAEDKEPLSAKTLAQRRAAAQGDIDRGIDWGLAEGNTPTDDEVLLPPVDIDPRSERVRGLALCLFPTFKDDLERAAREEWDRMAPVRDREEWYSACSFLATGGPDTVHLTGGPSGKTERDKKLIAAMRAYLDAAAKEGITPAAPASSSARTEMHGCGADRYEHSTYRWEYDGTHIYGADSTTVPSERTYWTDENGFLVGKDKGGPGQTWTLTQWKPPAPQPNMARALLFTGLFGPFGVALDGILGS